MEMKYCLQILFSLLWISKTRGQIHTGRSTPGYRTVGYITTRNGRGGINQYPVHLHRRGSRPNIENFMFGRIITVPSHRPGVGRVPGQAVMQRPVIINASAHRRQAYRPTSVRTPLSSPQPQSAMINQQFSMISNGPGRYFANRAPPSVNSGQRTVFVNIPASVPTATSRTMPVTSINTAQNVQQWGTASVLRQPFAQAVPSPTYTPVVFPSNVATNRQVPTVNLLAIPRRQVQPNNFQSGKITASVPQINTHGNYASSYPTAATQSRDTSADNPPTNAAESSSGSPGTDILLRNILNEVRATRERSSTGSSHSSGDITNNRLSDNILRRGDQLFKPLYKGNLFGDRIVLARGIGSASSVQDSSTLLPGTYQSVREGIRLVGEDVAAPLRRFSGEGRLPTVDASYQENGISWLPDSQSNIEQMNVYTSTTSDNQQSSSDRNMFDRNGYTETRQRGEASLSGSMHSSEMNQAGKSFGETNSVYESQTSGGQMDRLMEFFPSDWGTESRYNKAQVYSNDGVTSRSRFDVNSATDGFLQSSNDPSMLSSDSRYAFPGKTGAITESNPSPAGGTEQGVINTSVDRSHSLSTGTDMMHGHVTSTNNEYATESLIADTASATSDFTVGDGFIPSSDAGTAEQGTSGVFSHSMQLHSHRTSTGFESSRDVSGVGLLDAAFEPGHTPPAATIASGSTDGFISPTSDGNVTEARFVSLPGVSWNQPDATGAFNERQTILSSGLSSTTGMDSLALDSMNHFDLPNGLTGSSQHRVRDLSTSGSTLIGFDVSSSRQGSISGLQTRDQLGTAWSNFGFRQSSGFFPDMAGVDALSCPSQSADFGVCRDDSDCTLGYCFLSGSIKGICCA